MKSTVKCMCCEKVGIEKEFLVKVKDLWYCSTTCIETIKNMGGFKPIESHNVVIPKECKKD